MFRFHNCRPVWALTILVALMQSGLSAATKVWIGNAAAQKQITTITVGGTTWADGTATMTINGKGVVVTPVGSESEANIAIALQEAWMSPVRLDGTGTTDATSNAGGQEFGEFTEVTATVENNVVTLIANQPGVPFTVTVIETSTAGTLALATPQEATGPHHWDNPKNWEGGVVPANGDTVVYRDSNASCKYNLPAIGATSLELTGDIQSTFEGDIGLRKINRTNPSKPYREYRTPRGVELDATGSGTAITHKIGFGHGQASRFINWSHEGDIGLVVSAIVYKTNSAVETSEPPLQLHLSNATSAGTVTVFDGTVQLSETSTIGTLKVLGGNVTMAGNTADLAIDQAGGSIEMTDATTMGGNLTLNLTGGTFLSRMATSANSVTATVEKSRLTWNSGEAIDTLEIRKAGIVDGEQDLTPLTITNCNLYEGAALLMGNGRAVTFPNNIRLNRTDLDGVQVRIGTNKQLGVTAIP